MFSSAVAFALLWLVGAQTSVVDLTGAPANRAHWKIVESRSGGSIGAWPKPASQTPVAVHVTGCVVRDEALYFSVEVDNDRELEVEVPISMDSTLFDGRDTITFRELQINLGSAGDDGRGFMSNPAIEPVELFGDHSVSGTTRTLAPGDRLILRLRTGARPGHRELVNLRARVAGSDVTLSPNGAGYDQSRTWIPALFTTSQPASCSPEPETR
jgi:hypothetical protein